MDEIIGSAFFGTPLVELENDDQGISKKPLSVENQIVTDEKGRRRFHGAFTGGFSAGYFNTVGSKVGWTPKNFKSSLNERVGEIHQRPEDFMDEEDLGEFGIAPRKIRTARQFQTETEVVEKPISIKSALVYETDALHDLIKPVRESIGVKLMQQMGWRFGKRIGVTKDFKPDFNINNASTSSKKFYGCAMAPSLELITDSESENVEIESTDFATQRFLGDVECFAYQEKNDIYGLGYTAANLSNHVACFGKPKNESKFKLLPFNKSGVKGITGQAFGVGAFEEDDADVYTTENFMQYDFSLGATNVDPSSYSYNNYAIEFVASAISVPSRKFFSAPRLPQHYHPSSKAVCFDKLLPKSVNPAQRANVLGETHSVMTLLSDADRSRLEAVKANSVAKAELKFSSNDNSDPQQSAIFSSDVKKQRRFLDFIAYLRKGLAMPKPLELTEWEWSQEQESFTLFLPSDISQQTAFEIISVAKKPLTSNRIDLTKSFQSRLQARFTKGGIEETAIEIKILEESDQQKAVNMQMFGAMTRRKFDWYPDKLLCRRFNIPNPFPDSKFVGVPALSKQREESSAALFEMVALPSTKDELLSRERSHHRNVDEINKKQAIMQESNSVSVESAEQQQTSDPQEVIRPSMELFQSIFGQSDSDSDVDASEINSSSVSDPRSSVVKFSRWDAEKTDTELKNFDFLASLHCVTNANKDELENGLKQYLNEPVTLIEGDKDDSNYYGPVLPPEATNNLLSETKLINVEKYGIKKKSSKRHKKKKVKSAKRSRKHTSRKHRCSKSTSSSSSSDSTSTDS